VRAPTNMRYSEPYKQELFDKVQDAFDGLQNEADEQDLIDEQEADVTLTVKDLRYLIRLMERFELVE
jgi:hypothetical protein